MIGPPPSIVANVGMTDGIGQSVGILLGEHAPRHRMVALICAHLLGVLVGRSGEVFFEELGHLGFPSRLAINRQKENAPFWRALQALMWINRRNLIAKRVEIALKGFVQNAWSESVSFEMMMR